MMDKPAGAMLRIEQPPQTLREIATDRIRDAILSGYFKSGERLVERSLCDQLGVSRSVVREVIRYLEAEGLVEFLPNRGPIVAPLDWDQARQIYKVRMLLEADAAADCARLAEPKTKVALRQALDAINAAFAKGETRPLIEATTEFYRRIFVAAGHDVSWEVVNRLNGRISRLRGMTLSTADRHKSGFARMTRIFEAIEANDANAAAQAVQEHISEASRLAQEQIERAG